MISTSVGESIPPNTKHAVSVCLPTWAATVGYEEGDPAVVKNMTTGYPRFFIHKLIQKLCSNLAAKFAKEDETCLVFPSYQVAKRCREFVRIKGNGTARVRILQLATPPPATDEERSWRRECRISVVFVAKDSFGLLKQYWQHTGEIVSSRMAEYVLQELSLVEKREQSRKTPTDDKTVSNAEIKDEEDFIEKRFGRNLDLSSAERAKLLIKRRIARKVVDVEGEDGETPRMHELSITTPNEANGGQSMVTSTDSSIPAEEIQQEEHAPEPVPLQEGIHVNAERDVYLFPSGMASIFTAHRLLLSLDACRVRRRPTSQGERIDTPGIHSPNTGALEVVGYGTPYKKTVMFGFPYTDTLSILRKFNHTHFLGDGDGNSMQQLKEILHSGEQILAVFMEAPSNPLLKMGDLIELRELADAYGFYIVVDETAGGFVNIDVLPHADIVCSSLTKIFSGDSNVMAGSLVLNPRSPLYGFAQQFFQNGDYEDLLWCEDVIYLERNSRDFVSRTLTVNSNTKQLLDDVLIPQEGKLFKKIFYPSLTSDDTTKNYDTVRCAKGGYGGLFSLTFFSETQAQVFFDSLQLCKGPSLGTNFTLACPYAVLAHYGELEEVAKYGVERNLVRVSVGLESPQALKETFRFAVAEAEKRATTSSKELP
ncbi:LAME_0G17546g1_1 [Lachancea meyersii CBS 8951]|uniref:cystathionine gamma-synthase n=1 Tax=Lachancea meyersii CBS 8951 TaxID=1266667 RepID=A0A1G4KBP8_9SACH|nr:LAME_0G17546g1_1 [Lachancea meyersii CBS 8951]